MNITIGQVATGDKFYKREKLINRLWKKIKSGHNILMSAPRRIGKTSIMQYCMENPINNYSVIYLITESVNNKNEFYRKLVKEVYDELKKYSKLKNIIKKIGASTKIKSISLDGISFESKEIDYFEEFKTVVEMIEIQNYKLVLMVDEFAQTVENIMQDEGESSAIKFLESVRELRINPIICDKMQFIFAGSIGLENIVAQLNATSTINDLYAFKVTPFSNEEALDYINTIPLKDETYNFTGADIEYLLKKLEWNIPYFINIILDEIENICDDKGTNNISKEVIDKAFLNALRNRSYFEHWHTRLRKAYKKNNYNFSKNILNFVAQHSSITKGEVLDIANELEVTGAYRDIISALEYDGYLYCPDNTDKYVFNSPLLKQWWLNNVTN